MRFDDEGYTVKVLVSQRGARLRYAVPRMLEDLGMLAALYTDSSAFSRLGKLSCYARRLGIGSDRVSALTSRIPHGIPASKVFSFDRTLFSGVPGLDWLGKDLSKAYMDRGLQGADAVYSMYGEEWEFLVYAKRTKSVKLIVDVYISPVTDRITHEESMKLFSKPLWDERVIREREQRNRDLFELADIILCPSAWVREGVLAFTDCDSKIKIIPYGSSVDPIDLSPKTRSKTFLFAGRDAMRKGLHYLAGAARRVRESHPEWTFSVAGLEAGDVGWIEDRGCLNFLGTVPMDQMGKLYADSTALIMPSLSEGQASVVLEAMAHGCIPIVSHESGVDLPKDMGFSIQSRDTDSIVRACTQIIESKHTLLRDAEQVRDFARQYSMALWRERLSALLQAL